MDPNLARIEVWMLSARKCHVCGGTYTNKTSVGMHQCREHFGIIRDGKYTCCLRMAPCWADSLASVYETNSYMCPEDKGCIPADHNDYGVEYVPYSRATPEKGEGIITMPLHIYKLFDVYNPYLPNEHEVSVFQYDETAKIQKIEEVQREKRKKKSARI